VIALCWSGGKDSALALRALGRVDVLLTTFDEASAQVPHHNVPIASIRAQAAAAGLPLVEVAIPTGAPNSAYEARMAEAFAGPLAGVEAVAFGDLFLADLREYREARLAEIGVAARFPLWGRDTGALAREFVDAGFRARVVAIDEAVLDRSFVGRELDHALLDDLPAGVDPCGERGEFHTFVHAGPVFAGRVDVSHG
jgi:uncharacterized protein (TIGR00290 family)